MNVFIKNCKQKVTEIQYKYDGRFNLEIWRNNQLIDNPPLNFYEILMLKRTCIDGVVPRAVACKVLGENYIHIIESAIST